MLNGLSVARIEVLLLPVVSVMRPLDPTPSLQPHYEPSSLLRVGPPQCSASVRSPRGFRRLGFSLRIRATGSCSSTRQPDMRFTPPLRRSPSAQSSGTPRTCPRRTIRPWFRRLLSFLTTRLRRVHSRSSLGCSPARVNSRFSSNAHHHASLPQRLGGGLRPAPESRSRGTFPHLSRSLTYSHGWLVHNELLLRALLQHTLVKKLVPVAPEQELFAHCSAPFEDKAGPGGPLPGEIPGILNICDGYAMDMRYMCCEPIVRCPVDF